METDNVTVAVLRGECVDCSRDFVSYALPDLSYGYKLLQFVNDGSVAAVLRCLDNPVVYELLDIVAKVAGNKADVNVAVGICCDPINGKSMGVGLSPKCPACGSSNVDEFDSQPSQMAVLELPHVTHELWERQSREGREQAVRRCYGA